MYAIPVLLVLTVLVIWQAASPTSGGTASSTVAAGPITSSAAGPAPTSAPVRSSAPPTRTSGSAQIDGSGPSPDPAISPSPVESEAPTADPSPDPATEQTQPAQSAGLTPDPANITPDALRVPSGALPAGQDFVPTGAGTWHEVPGTGPVLGTGPRALTYSIQVEDGIQDTAADAEFATQVDAVLADPRSWIGGGQVSLQRVSGPDASFQIALTSQNTAHSNDMCGFSVQLEPSCYERNSGRVLINNSRWARGAMVYGTDLTGYRTYVINHEVGHALGNGHEACPVDGAPAPVMMQQSWSTSDDDLAYLNPQVIPADGKVCTANPYPFPQAVTPAEASVASG